MKLRTVLAFFLAVAFVFAFSACGGQDKRVAAAEQLISAYYQTDAKSGNVVVLKVQTYQDGYLVAALYKGSGSHLVLFKVGKNRDADAIAATGEGEPADGSDYSVNIIADGDKTIMFGNFKNAPSGYGKIDFVFDNSSHITQSVAGDAGYIVIADGSLKVKDFTLFDPKGDAKNSYQDFLKAGGSVVRTTFMSVAAK